MVEKVCICLLDRDPLDLPMLGVLLKKANLSTLRPIFGVFDGDASIKGIDNSSYKGLFFISPFCITLFSSSLGDHIPHLCLQKKVFQG